LSYLQTKVCYALVVASALLSACSTKDDPAADSGAKDFPDVGDVSDSAPGTGRDASADAAMLDASTDAAMLDASGDTATLDAGGDTATLDASGDTATLDAGGDTATLDGGGGSVSCYSAEQMRCEEAPLPSDEQRQDIPIMCSSVSGVFTSPAACPSAGFIGKCVVGTGRGQEVRRRYTGNDATYEADFCTNTAHGTWSTVF
jgi:hypothetical protein